MALDAPQHATATTNTNATVSAVKAGRQLFQSLLSLIDVNQFGVDVEVGQFGHQLGNVDVGVIDNPEHPIVVFTQHSGRIKW